MESNSRKKVVFIVDGLNLYHAVKNRYGDNFLSINLAKLTNLLIKKDEEIEEIDLCTSYFFGDSENAKRQRNFISKNKLLNDLKVFTGEYKLRVIKCEKCGNSVKKYSEKYTDVNIALRIVKFFENNEISKVYLLSADADFLPVVNKFNLSHPSKKIVVVIPPGRYSSSFKSKIHITKSHISKSLFS